MGTYFAKTLPTILLVYYTILMRLLWGPRHLARPWHIALAVL